MTGSFSRGGRCGSPKVTFRSFYALCGLLVPLIKAGYTVGTALETVSKSRTCKKGESALAMGILTHMRCGETFATAALSLFPALHRFGGGAILVAFEKAGHLDAAFSYFVQKCAKEENRRETVSSAALYPLLVLLLVAALTVFLVRAAPLFGIGDGGRLVLSAVAKGAAFLLLYVCGVGCALGRYARPSPLEQFYELMSLCLSTSLSLEQALDEAVLLESPLTADLLAVQRDMAKGVPFADSLGCHPSFRREDTTLMEIATNSADLADAFAYAAGEHRRKARKREEKALSLLEPALITGVGGYLVIVLTEAVLPFLVSFGGIL